jgi:hypothetical protein
VLQLQEKMFEKDFQDSCEHRKCYVGLYSSKVSTEERYNGVTISESRAGVLFLNACILLHFW